MKTSMLLGLSAVAFSACSDWTDVESVNLNNPTLETQNPQLYEAYLENLREYRKSEHKQVYVWFDNSEKVPFNRSQHLTDLPDSVDVIALMYPDGLTDWEMDEMAEIREKKGTKFIYSVDFEAIKEIYNIQMNKDADEEPVADDFIGFLADSLEHSLSLVSTYGYDGICIGYQGKSQMHMRPSELKEYMENENAFIKIITDWHQRNPQGTIDYEGKPENLIDKTLLEDCYNIFVSGKAASCVDDFTYILLSNLAEGVPNDRYGMTVMGIDLADEDKTIGYLSNGLLAMTGLAEWAVYPHQGIIVKSVGVYNVSADYHSTIRSYHYLRSLISIITPPIK